MPCPINPRHLLTLRLVALRSIEALGDYYDLDVQPFAADHAEGVSTLTVGGEDQGNVYVGGNSTGGNVTAAFVAVSNFGCHPSDYPSEVKGNFALIPFAGTCEDELKLGLKGVAGLVAAARLKSAHAGAAGAVAAVVYRNGGGAINNLSGQALPNTLTPPRPEGVYVPTIGIAQETGASILAALGAGKEVIGVLGVIASVNTVTTYV